MHVISQIIDGGAIEANGGASAPVGPTVATPLLVRTAILVIYVIDPYFLVKILIVYSIAYSHLFFST